MFTDIFKTGKKNRASFNILIHDYHNIHIVRLRGAIDMSTISEINEFRQAAREKLGLLHMDMVLNFKNVSHVDSATCAELVKVQSELGREKHRLILVDVPREFKSLLEISRVSDLFSIYKSEKKALKQLITEHVSDSPSAPATPATI